jgi:hypothetical protein
MFEESIRNAAFGIAIALSAVGFAARSAEAGQEGDFLNREVATQTFDPGAEAPLAEVSIAHQQPSGALEGLKPPVLDGAVPWSYVVSTTSLVLASGGIGLILGGYLGFNGSKEFSIPEEYTMRNGLAGAALGAAILSGAAYINAGESNQIINFETQIVDVIDAQPEHYGKSGESTVGPLSSQIVVIPELSTPLAVNSHSVPFIPGQRIKATFSADSQGHITGWYAESALRPQ